MRSVRLEFCAFAALAILRAAPVAAAEPSARSQAAARTPPRATNAPKPSAPAATAPTAAAPISPPADAPSFDSGDGPPGVDAAAKARARSLYEQGVRAYAAGSYYQAADAFAEANRIYATPQLAFNIAKAYERINNQAGALSQYREYLRHSPGAADYDEIVARVHELEAALAARGVQQLSVLSDPDNAIVLLDGRAVGLTPWTGETWPGKHRVELELAAHQHAEMIVELEAHRAEDVTFKLAPLPAPTTEPLAPAHPVEKSASVGALSWVALGTGVAALGAALFVEMADKNTTGLTRTGAFFGGAGLAAATLGGVLVYFDLSAPSDEPARKTSTEVKKPSALRAVISARF